MYLTVLLPLNCVVSCCICVLWGGVFIVVLCCCTVLFIVLFSVYTIIYLDPPSTHKIGILPHMFCTCTYFFIGTWRMWVYSIFIYIYEYIHVTEQGMVRGHGLRLASTSPEWRSENWIGELDSYPRIAELRRLVSYLILYMLFDFLSRRI